jgi:phosphoenolpyruvate-protein phosphotransferase (PTS system enzyme I)
MKTIFGKSISPGYAHGHAVRVGVGQPKKLEKHIHADQVGGELARFQAALEDSYRELEQLKARVQSELGTDSADIFSAHMLFLQDPQFIDRVTACIRNERLSLESSIQVTIDELQKILTDTDNVYLRERAADVRDLHRRLLRHIAPSGTEILAQLAPGSILVARELLPSDLLEFDREHLAGVITEIGGETGHAAILARALGIPAVTGITDATRLIDPDMALLIDGQTGEVVLEPEPKRLQASIAIKNSYDTEFETAIEAETRECVTQDAVRVNLLANIGREFEIEQVREHHLEGVGLFRTEYLFLDEETAPSFERQRDIYCKIARSLADLPLVIRTLDLGGDKWPAFLKPKFEANPNLGVRGLRFSLMASEDLFHTQIRAALHAADEYDVRIMLPMVLGRTDLQQAMTIIQAVADEEGISELPPIGTLVETPSAVFAIDEILAISDFISIGTNDLTQFIMAADRNALAMIDDYTVLHPSVLRAVHQVIKAAQAAGKPATICGEAAADPRVACLLVGLGARRLSLSPLSAARIRYALRASLQCSLEELANEALNSDSAQTVAKLISDALKSTCPEFITWLGYPLPTTGPPS